MKRPLTLFERGLYLDGKQAMNVFAVASVLGQIDEAAFRQALLKLQSKHEILGCLIVYENGRPFFVPQQMAPAIPLRIVEGYVNGWAEIAAQESERCFDGTREPLLRLLWLRVKEQNKLVLVCHHAICDGRSLFTLFDEILKNCGDPERDPGKTIPLKSIYECLPAKVIEDRALALRIRWIARLLKLGLRLPYRRKEFKYGRAYRIFWTLEEPLVGMLEKQSKEHGVNLYSALLAAFMQAFSTQHGPPHRIEKFVVPVDVRRYLPHLPRGSLFAIAPTISIPLVTNRRHADRSCDDFWATASHLNTELAHRIDRLKSRIHMMILGMEQLHEVYERMQAFARSRRVGRNVTLSYVGRPKLAQDYRGFRLESIVLSAMLHPTPATLIVISSFAGKLDFSMASDEASLPQAAAVAAKEKAMALLSEYATSPQSASRQADCTQKTPSEQAEVH